MSENFDYSLWTFVFVIIGSLVGIFSLFLQWKFGNFDRKINIKIDEVSIEKRNDPKDFSPKEYLSYTITNLSQSDIIIKEIFFIDKKGNKLNNLGSNVNLQICKTCFKTPSFTLNYDSKETFMSAYKLVVLLSTGQNFYFKIKNAKIEKMD